MLNLSRPDRLSGRSTAFGALLLSLLWGTGGPVAADPTLAGGLYHSLAVDSSGRVLAWGEDGSGQLGSGRSTFVATPTVVSGQPAGTVVALSAGVFHSVALLDDGRVLAWGNNAEGSLGDGGTQSHSSPLPVVGLAAVARIHSGERHVLAVDAQNRAWSWGLNHQGQLGHSANAYQANTPLQVPLSDVSDARGGAAHSVALTRSGEVWAWGDNRYGQLGVAAPSQSSTPVRVVFPSGTARIVAIEVAGDTSYALDSDKKLWAWGDNRYRQLADANVANRSAPGLVTGLGSVTALSAGRVGAGAVLSDGTVWTWGGYDAVTPPTKLAGVVGPATALRVGEYHLVVQLTDGTLVAAGGNFNGQLGDGTSATPAAGATVKPLGVSGPVKAFAAGNKHTLAIDANGRILGWGDDLKGQTGSASETTRNVPAVVAKLGLANEVAAGDSHSLALLRDGTVMGWGDNFGGAVGSGNTGVRTTPEAVRGLTGIRHISAAKASSAALDAAGALWVWGDNSRGQLARPLEESGINVPIKAKDVQALAQVALGGTHSVGLDASGKVWAWGDNTEGQLGDASKIGGPTPRSVAGLSDIRALAAGEAHTLALDGQGRVWAWGRNKFAQVSPADDMVVSAPVQVAGLPRVVAVAAGLGSSLALDDTGRLWGWGLNQFGELGQGGTGFTLKPSLVDGDTYARLSAAPWHTLATRTDGVAWAFGWNDYGQLGDGSFVRQVLPVGVVNTTLDAFLDLQSEGINLPVPAGKAVPFFSQTRKVGSSRRLQLSTGIQVPVVPSARGVHQKAAVGYNVYVVALVPGAVVGQAASPAFIFLKSRTASWQSFAGFPLAEYLRGVSQDANNSILVDILTNDDISLLVGTKFLIGYGLDDQEMLAAGRFRLVYEVQPPL
ncbi:MAG: RCC1 repeat-containing protein [Burkholderiales bacterium PBB2]|nr:MAG: RCC1 repeat-containing protein [Burkholderiales bacterium PBB2]